MIDIKDFNNSSEDIKLTAPPERHVVFSNFEIKNFYPDMSSYLMTGWDFGTPNTYHKTTRRLMPFGLYIFDEAQRYFDGKSNTVLPPWVTEAFELRGHIFIDIVLIAQKYMRMHSDIRATADLFTYIEESIHTFIIKGKKVHSKKFLASGKLIKTRWIGRQFTEEYEIERYLKGEKELGTKFNYVFDGDIRDYYDPYSFAVKLEDCSKDFNYYDYNNTFGDRPDSWSSYKKDVKKKEEKNEKA